MFVFDQTLVEHLYFDEGLFLPFVPYGNQDMAGLPRSGFPRVFFFFFFSTAYKLNVCLSLHDVQKV